MVPRRPRWGMLRWIAGLSLFLIQGTLAVLFFWNLGSGGLESAILAATGVSLELTKRYCWSLSGNSATRGLRIGLAVAFSLVSGIAVMVYSWSASEASLERSLENKNQIFAIQSQVRNLEEERHYLESKVRALPADWVTLSLKYTARIVAISNEERDLQLRETGLEGRESERLQVGLYFVHHWVLDRGLPWELLLFLFFLFCSILLEVGVAITAMPRSVSQNSIPVHRDLLILKAAFQGRGQPLLSRRKIAKTVNTSEAEVRRVLNWLRSENLIRSHQGGNRFFPILSLDECIARWDNDRRLESP